MKPPRHHTWGNPFPGGGNRHRRTVTIAAGYIQHPVPFCPVIPGQYISRQNAGHSTQMQRAVGVGPCPADKNLSHANSSFSNENPRNAKKPSSHKGTRAMAHAVPPNFHKCLAALTFSGTAQTLRVYPSTNNGCRLRRSLMPYEASVRSFETMFPRLFHASSQLTRLSVIDVTVVLFLFTAVRL
ncbi:hypothetical protein D3C75_901460 [compost metagenome]